MSNRQARAFPTPPEGPERAVSHPVVWVAAGTSSLLLSLTINNSSVDQPWPGVFAAFFVLVVVGSWVLIDAVLAAQSLALGQGFLWLALLLHSGLGLVFAPAGWFAALIARKHPAIASAVLAIPTVLTLVIELAVFQSDFVTAEPSLSMIALFAPAAIAVGILSWTSLSRRVEPSADLTSPNMRSS